jgi:hypothetical protein
MQILPRPQPIDMTEQIPHRNNRRGVEPLYRRLQSPRWELRVGRAGEVELTLLLLLLLLSLWLWSDLDVRDLLEFLLGNTGVWRTLDGSGYVPC